MIWGISPSYFSALKGILIYRNKSYLQKHFHIVMADNAVPNVENSNWYKDL